MRVFYYIFFLIIFSLSLNNCKNHNAGKKSNDRLAIKLYKISLYEQPPYSFYYNSEFILINNSGKCIPNIIDYDKLSFLPDSIFLKHSRIEYVSKYTNNPKTEISENDTVFYRLQYRFRHGNKPFFDLKKNIYKYIKEYKKLNIIEGNVHFTVDESVKVFYSHHLPYYEQFGFDLPGKSPYEKLRYKYDNFYNK